MKHHGYNSSRTYNMEGREERVEGKKEIWNKIFGSEYYNPNYDYSKFVKTIKENLQSGYSPEKYQGASKTKIRRIIELVENRNCKLDIDFLESLDDENKYLISKLFIDEIIKCIENKPGVKLFIKQELENGIFRSLSDKEKRKSVRNFLKGILLNRENSLLIWMIFWNNYNYKSKSIDHNCFERDIDLESERFNSLYFLQAYNFLLIMGGNKDLSDKYKFNLLSDKLNLKNPDKFLFDVLVAYNLIKNLDGDIESMNKLLNLGEDFSLKVFHAKDKIGAGYIQQNFSLDSNGKKTGKEKDLAINGFIFKEDTDGRKYIALNRESPLLFDKEGSLVDAGGKDYRLYLDSPLGVSLLYKNEPIAVISFIIKNGEELFINQIQRVPYEEYDEFGRCIAVKYSNDFCKIDREKSLYEIVEKIAHKYGVSRIIIQSGKNNRRTKEYIDNSDSRTPYYNNNFAERDEYKFKEYECAHKRVHLLAEIAEKIYDNFAKQKGLYLDKRGNYVKDM